MKLPRTVKPPLHRGGFFRHLPPPARQTCRCIPHIILLTVTSNEGALSTMIRGLFDGGDVDPLTKTTKTRTTGAQVGIVSHITSFELSSLLSQTEQLNGFGNRFLWVCARRQGVIAFPSRLSDDYLTRIRIQITECRDEAKSVGALKWGPGAKELYESEYPELSRARGGLSGCMVGRGEAMTVRMAMIYALIAKHKVLMIDDLRAALAAWQYCRDSSLFLFGDTPADRSVTKIMLALENGQMTRKEIMVDVFSGHIRQSELDRLLPQMESDKLITIGKVPTKGRPETRILKYLSEQSELSELSTRHTGHSSHSTHSSPSQKKNSDIPTADVPDFDIEVEVPIA